MKPSFVLGGIFFGLAAAMTGCKAHPTAEECGKMLDRYVDMTAGQDPAFAGLDDTRAAALRAQKLSQKRLEASYTTAMTRCQTELSKKELDCAMTAPTPNDWEACIE